MIKQSIEIPCECGDKKCTRLMNVHEDDENSKLTILSVKTKFDFLPEFFSLNHDSALRLVKWLISRYKLRNELDGKTDENVTVMNKHSEPEPLPGQIALFEADMKETDNTDDTIEVASEPSKTENTQPVKRGRGRPRKQ